MVELNNFLVSEVEVSYIPKYNYSDIVRNPSDAYNILFEAYNKKTISYKEELIILYMDKMCRVLGVYKIAEGGTSHVIGDFKVIFAVALKVAASAFIISHNHPSGNLKASDEDVKFTKKLMQAAEIMGLKMFDSLIVTPSKGVYSSIEH